MLSNIDKSSVAKLLHETAIYYQRTLPPMQMQMYLNALENFTLDEINRAIQAHMIDRQSGHFMPMISQIVAKIDDTKPRDPSRTHPAPNEAWAIALSGIDEYDTVVTTPQILEAWGVARPVFECGDEIGARMAFIDAYRRIISSCGPPAWFASYGMDPQRRQIAVQQAVAKGLLPPASAPWLALPTPPSDGGNRTSAVIVNLRQSMSPPTDERPKSEMSKYREREEVRRREMLERMETFAEGGIPVRDEVA